jgi:hypothetical protein
VSLDDLLLAWVFISISSVSSPRSKPVEGMKVVQELVLGKVEGLLPQSDLSLPEEPGINSSWFVQAVSAYILWLSSLNLDGAGSSGTLTPETTPPTPSIATRAVDKFSTELLLTVLALRPSLSECADSTAATVSMKPLFQLAAALLSGSNAAKLAIPNDVCKAVSTQIMSELETLSTKLKAGEHLLQNTAVLSNLEGTVMLLVAMASREAAVMDSLSQQESLDFILYDCLGLAAIADCKQPILCEEEKTR